MGSASNVVFDDTRSFDNIYADQGRGPSASNALIWNHNAPSVSILNSTYTDPGNPNNIVWEGSPREPWPTCMRPRTRRRWSTSSIITLGASGDARRRDHIRSAIAPPCIRSEQSHYGWPAAGQRSTLSACRRIWPHAGPALPPK